MEGTELERTALERAALALERKTLEKTVLALERIRSRKGGGQRCKRTRVRLEPIYWRKDKDSVGKDSIGKGRIGKDSIGEGSTRKFEVKGIGQARP